MHITIGTREENRQVHFRDLEIGVLYVEADYHNGPLFLALSDLEVLIIIDHDGIHRVEVGSYANTYFRRAKLPITLTFEKD